MALKCIITDIIYDYTDILNVEYEYNKHGIQFDMEVWYRPILNNYRIVIRVYEN